MTPEEHIERLTPEEQMFVAALLEKGFRLLPNSRGENSSPGVFASLSDLLAIRAGLILGEGEVVVRKDVDGAFTTNNLEVIPATTARHRLAGYSGKFKGVFRTDGGKYAARSKANGGNVGLGTYASAEEAARVYDTHVCRTLPGAYLNFPEDHQECVPGTCQVDAQPVYRPEQGTGDPSGYQSSEYTGVYSVKRTSFWDWSLYRQGKRLRGSGFTTPEAANEARLAKLEELGEGV